MKMWNFYRKRSTNNKWDVKNRLYFKIYEKNNNESNRWPNKIRKL